MGMGLRSPTLDESRNTKRFALGSLISSTILVRFLIEHEPSSLQHGHRSYSHMRSKRLSVCVVGQWETVWQARPGNRRRCGQEHHRLLRIWLQPALHGAAACTAWGCSLHCTGLKSALHEAVGFVSLRVVGDEHDAVVGGGA